jgi:hypothetical protein
MSKNANDGPAPLSAPFPVYVGWDSREPDAYEVCRHSIQRNSSVPVDVRPLKLGELGEQGLYWRGKDPLASVEFIYTRFLVPHLMGYQGWALFCDCDFLWLGDIARLISLTDDRYAAMCVHHDHQPTETRKMDGQIQTRFPRKNWSSMVLYNCGHPANRVLTPETVNEETGAFLHRFRWLEDELIGEVPVTWNWLEGWNKKPQGGPPDVVHFTRGGPWFEQWKDVDYGDLWLKELAQWEAGERQEKRRTGTDG